MTSPPKQMNAAIPRSIDWTDIVFAIVLGLVWVVVKFTSEPNPAWEVRRITTDDLVSVMTVAYILFRARRRPEKLDHWGLTTGLTLPALAMGAALGLLACSRQHQPHGHDQVRSPLHLPNGGIHPGGIPATIRDVFHRIGNACHASCLPRIMAVTAIRRTDLQSCPFLDAGTHSGNHYSHPDGAYVSRRLLCSLLLHQVPQHPAAHSHSRHCLSPAA